MTTLLEFFTGAWAQALGFTVLHSLWQAFLIMVLATGVLRFVPVKHSGTRYAVAGAGLLAIFIASVGTFLYLISNTSPLQPQEFEAFSISFSSAPESTPLTVSALLTQAASFVHSIVPFVVLLWSVGAFMFSLRFFGSWWYTARLKEQALPIDSAWQARVEALANRFNIQRIVTLAESARISAPVVIGYLKPMILIPVGMCAGLSTAQLESIFIHELIHIRRNDYLVNLLQSVIEALYFFNPFAWMISSILRQEREHCCDDAVVLHQGNALAYAHALAALEEARLTRAGVALGLAENKNQLLNRIKRIMEKSVQNYSPRERMVPVILLVVGLACASWLTIQSEKAGEDLAQPTFEPLASAASDTTKKRNPRAEGLKKISSRSDDDKTVYIETYHDEDEDIDEDMDFDMDMGRSFHFGSDFNLGDMHFVMPPLPPMPAMDALDHMDIDIDIPEIPDIPELAAIPPVDFNHNWEAFDEAFEEKFKERFGEFYEKNEKEMQEMMEDVEESLQKNLNHELIAEQAAHSAELARHQAEVARIQVDKMMDSDSWKKFNDDMKVFEQKMKVFETRMKDFENELRDELVKDGYIKSDEKINDIHWSDDGNIKINDKQIKESDKPKYRKLHDKYFKDEE